MQWAWQRSVNQVGNGHLNGFWEASHRWISVTFNWDCISLKLSKKLWEISKSVKWSMSANSNAPINILLRKLSFCTRQNDIGRTSPLSLLYDKLIDAISSEDVTGIEPLKVFQDRSNSCRFITAASGKLPSSEFDDRLRYRRDGNLIRVPDIVPMILFVAKFKYRSCIHERENGTGIFPVKPFSLKFIKVALSNDKMSSGIVP